MRSVLAVAASLLPALSMSRYSYCNLRVAEVDPCVRTLDAGTRLLGLSVRR